MGARGQLPQTRSSTYCESSSLVPDLTNPGVGRQSRQNARLRHNVRFAGHTGGIDKAKILDKAEILGTLKWTTLWPEVFRSPDVTS